MRMPAASIKRGERRASERVVLAHPEAMTITVGEVAYQARIEDLSLDGARLSFDVDLPPNAAVELQHRFAGDMRGECIWRGPRSMGVRFRRASDLAHALQCVVLLTAAQAGD
jgi:hypothetical protein